jgi:hypothetical protein
MTVQKMWGALSEVEKDVCPSVPLPRHLLHGASEDLDRVPTFSVTTLLAPSTLLSPPHSYLVPFYLITVNLGIPQRGTRHLRAAQTGV